jgi:hypothetical protein
MSHGRRPNQSLQPTAGRSDEELFHDFSIKLRSKARCRQDFIQDLGFPSAITLPLVHQ